jgi:hypothetical protein
MFPPLVHLILELLLYDNDYQLMAKKYHSRPKTQDHCGEFFDNVGLGRHCQQETWEWWNFGILGFLEEVSLFYRSIFPLFRLLRATYFDLSLFDLPFFRDIGHQWYLINTSIGAF